MNLDLTNLAVLSALGVAIWRFCTLWAGKIFEIVKSCFITTLHVHSSDIAYEYYLDFIQKHKSDIVKNYKFGVSTKLHGRKEEGRWYNSIGLGLNIVKYKNKFLIVTQNRETGAGSNWFEKIDLYISCYKNSDLLQEITQEVYKKSKGDDSTKIYIYESGWSYLNVQTKRDINTIFWNDKEKENLLHDVGAFYDSESLYMKIGLPYKRGYLLYGKPGTGKSSMIFAIAGNFNKNIAIINISSLSNDNQMLKAFSSVPNNAILILEDIDLIFKKLSENKEQNEKNNITFSGVLNALDGISYKEGLITFLTTNHIDRIDDAVLRNGRVDNKIEVTDLDKKAIKEMCTFFEKDAEEIIKKYGDKINPSKLKNLLIKKTTNNI